jgi:predicted phage terminase large subunit-like protein
MSDHTPEDVDAILRSDFLSFLATVFETLCPGEEFLDNWHLEVLAYQLGLLTAGQTRRLIVNIPPRSLKSMAISVAWPAFLLCHHPHLKIIVASYGQELAAKLSRDTRKVMEADWYRRIFPGTVVWGKDTEGFFETSANGSRRATSVNGPLTGMGADIIIVDDPHKAGDATSDVALKNTKEWYEQTLATRLNNKNTGIIVVVMQRLHEDDLSGHLLSRPGWGHLNIPAIAQIGCEHRFGPAPNDIHLIEAGDVIDDRRESLVTLRDVERDMGIRAFSAQYLQSPVPAGGNLFDWKWFKFYDRSKRPLTSFAYVFQSWDTASSENPGADYSVCTTWGIDQNGHAYLVDLWRGQLSFPDLIQRALFLEQKFKPDGIVGESVGSGLAFCQELRRRLGLRLQDYTPKHHKTVRAESITPMIERGEVFLPKDAPYLESLRNEIIAFPRGRNDDQVDSLVQLLILKDRLIRVCRFQGLCRNRVLKSTKTKQIFVPVPAGPGRLVSYHGELIEVEVVDA